MEAWSCAKCSGANESDDRYCGECGTARNPTIIAPVIRPATPAAGLLNDLKEPPSAAAQGILHVAAAGLLSAALFGGAYHYVARFIDFMILFPALLGLAVGMSIRLAALQGRCRRASLLVGAALVAGVGAYGVRQTLDTYKVQSDIRGMIADQASELSLPAPAEAMASFSFADAFRHRVETGVGFGRRSKTRVTGKAYWGFLAFEALVVAFVAAGTARVVASLAYCAACRAFMPPVPVFRVNGRDSARLADAVRRQHWKEAQEMSAQSSATAADRAEANLLRCSVCNGSSLRVDLHEGRRSKKVLHVALPPESLEALARTA